MRKALSVGMGVAVAVALAMMAGCEADPVNGQVFITPDSVAIANGQSVAFTATGGFDYEWSLQNNSYGVLSTRRGPTTTYRSLIDPGSDTNSIGNVTQILRVTSLVSGTSTTNAGQVTTGTAEAYITHI